MAYAPAALRWLATEWENAIPSAVFSGIVGDSAHTYGYHRAANEIPKTDYSRQLVGDRDIDGIDMNAADAIDMNMSKYDMILVTTRMYHSWRDQNDPRLNYWREVIGTMDGINVIYMDCQSGEQGTADDSHLWHMHAGGLRIHANNMEAMVAFLSIVKGETTAQWQAGGAEDMTISDPVLRSYFVDYDGVSVNPKGWLPRVLEARLGTRLDQLHNKIDAIAARVDIDATELSAIEAATKKGVEAGMVAQMDEFVAAVIASLPAGTLTKADVEASLRSVLGSLDN